MNNLDKTTEADNKKEDYVKETGDTKEMDKPKETDNIKETEKSEELSKQATCEDRQKHNKKKEFIQSLNISDKLLVAGTLLLGMVFVWLFYDKEPGISIPIFVILFYTLFFTYTKPVLSTKTWFGWFLSVPVFMLSLTYLLYGNIILLTLNFLAIPTLVLLQTMLITGTNSFNWYSPGILIDLCCGIVYRTLAHIKKPFVIVTSLFYKKTNDDGTKSVTARIMLGLIISLPLLLVLLSLLASADMVFKNFVDYFPKLLEKLNMDELGDRVIVAFIIFLISFSYLWSIAHGDKPADSALKSAPSPLSSKKGFLDPVTIITITAAVDLLYIVFVVIQFAYLFGRAGLPEGFTYAEYARSGFFELLLVTLLNIGFLVCTLTFTKKGNEGNIISFKLANTIIVCCTGIMLFSAYYRMSLYEEAYGYTFLRIMTQAFMVFIFVLIIIMLVRVWYDQMPLLKPYIAVAVISFTIVNYINVDTLIVKKNMERYYSTNIIDIEYFNSLSNVIISDVKKLSMEKDIEVATAAQKVLNQREKRLLEKKSWQSFNLTDYRAYKAIKNMDN